MFWFPVPQPKTFSAVYHLDNFYVRVHKYVENVHILSALLAGLPLEKRPSRTLVQKTLTKGHLSTVGAVLTQFVQDPLIQQVLQERRQFVHLYREERDWSMLQPDNRYEDTVTDPLADAFRTLAAADLDDYVVQKGNELTLTLDVMRAFRDRFFRVFAESVLRVGAKSLPSGRVADIEALVDLADE